MVRGMEAVREFRRQHSDSYNFNWLLSIRREFQQPFEVTHAAMRALELRPRAARAPARRQPAARVLRHRHRQRQGVRHPGDRARRSVRARAAIRRSCGCSMSCSPRSSRSGACGCPAAPTGRSIAWSPEAAAPRPYITLAHRCATSHTSRERARESCVPAYAARRHACEPVPAVRVTNPVLCSHNLQELLNELKRQGARRRARHATRAGTAGTPTGGADAYANWLDRMQRARARQAAITRNLYTWSNYKNWADQVRDSWAASDAAHAAAHAKTKK